MFTYTDNCSFSLHNSVFNDQLISSVIIHFQQFMELGHLCSVKLKFVFLLFRGQIFTLQAVELNGSSHGIGNVSF